MPIEPIGIAQVKDNTNGIVYEIAASELDWEAVGSDDKQMGVEVEYSATIHHDNLGELKWSVWEYPLGILNDAKKDMNGHELINDFNFVQQVESDEAKQELFVTEDDEVGISEETLERLPQEDQQPYLVAWFYSQFWDPAQETPYNSREGGYMYVYGGPYDANEELYDKFSHIVGENVIASAVEEIESDGTFEWAPSPNHPDQLQAEQDYYESMQPPNLEQFKSIIASKEELDYQSPEALAAQQNLNQSGRELLKALDSRRPIHGEMGHNGPAVDDEGRPLPDGFEEDLRTSITIIIDNTEKNTPDAQAIIEATSRLQRLRGWLQPRVDRFADAFAEQAGKKSADAILAAAKVGGIYLLASTIPGFDAILSSAFDWLKAITGI